MPVLVPTAPPPLSSGPVSYQMPTQPTVAAERFSSEARKECVEAKPGTKVPIVSLDVDKITDALAASLATSLLGHVLFLKSQVPLPVQQLSRIQSSKSTARAAKQRTDLLTSFDTLTSHLNTTFTALSTALARSSTSDQEHPNVGPPKDRARAYLAILVGPSMGSAKSKVMFAVDGLETKVWGLREDVHRDPRKEKEDNVEGDDNDYDDEDSSSGSDSFEEENEEEGNDSDVDTDDDEDQDEDDPEDSPPPSRSPSPEPLSHAIQQRALQVADRLLSRTLAAADADGHGMSADMAPTQTHILLRAPRRFVHPAWIPRQNMSASLDGALHEFLEASGLTKLTEGDVSNKKRKPKKGDEVEGVWIACRGGLTGGEDNSEELLPDTVQHAEWDEMIWWSWDGKIAGFSEW